MKLDIRTICQTEVLAGATFGETALRRLLENLPPNPSEPQPLFLDVGRIGFASSSFLRAAFLPFWVHVRSTRRNIYPVIANPNPAVAEEMADLLRTAGGAWLSCTASAESDVSNVVVLGSLEPKQKITFDEVCKRDETDAVQLTSDRIDGVQKATAWNNRLASLADMGLIVEITQGRSKRYRRVLENRNYGSRLHTEAGEK